MSGGSLLKFPAPEVCEACVVRGLDGVESFLVVVHAVAVVFEFGRKFVRLRPACPAASVLQCGPRRFVDPAPDAEFLPKYSMPD